MNKFETEVIATSHKSGESRKGNKWEKWGVLVKDPSGAETWYSTFDSKFKDIIDELSEGDTVEIDAQQSDDGFWNLKNIDRIIRKDKEGKPKSKGSDYERKQMVIIAQSTMSYTIQVTSKARELAFKHAEVFNLELTDARLEQLVTKYEKELMSEAVWRDLYKRIYGVYQG